MDKKGEEYYYPNMGCDLVQTLDDGSDGTEYYLMVDIYVPHVEESALSIPSRQLPA